MNCAIVLQGQANPLGGMIPILLMLIVIYFFFIRPQSKKQKEQVNFLDEIAKGDEVVLSSGIIGRVNKIEDNIVQIQTDQKNYLRVLKSAISKDMTQALNAKEEAK